jgi:transposase
MSTSLLYHAFGVRGYRYVSTRYEEGSIVLSIRQERQRLRCPVCASRCVLLHGGQRRLFRMLPIGRKRVYVGFVVPRVECRDCGVIRQVAIGFAEPRRSYTHAFERYAVELSRRMTIKDVAQHLGVSWDVIKDIQKRYLERHFARPRLRHLRCLAIDEIAVGKGRRYLTVVLDLESGAVVFVGEGRGADSLEPFWRRLRSARARIEAVAVDMSPAYVSAVTKNLPWAVLVFDRFHIIKLFNDRLTEFRRDLYHDARGRRQKQVLKGTRWLLLKNPENLDPAQREAQRLREALRLNRPLAAAYYMREDLRQIWEQPDQPTARRVLDDWLSRAEQSGVRVLQRMAATLREHRHGILAYYDYPLSTGPLEGTNNKIQTMKRQAYGFRDYAFYKLKIYALHETKYALIG